MLEPREAHQGVGGLWVAPVAANGRAIWRDVSRGERLLPFSQVIDGVIRISLPGVGPWQGFDGGLDCGLVTNSVVEDAFGKVHPLHRVVQVPDFSCPCITMTHVHDTRNTSTLRRIMDQIRWFKLWYETKTNNHCPETMSMSGPRAGPSPRGA